MGQKGSGDHLLHFAIFGYDMVSDGLSIIFKKYACIFIRFVSDKKKRLLFEINLFHVFVKMFVLLGDFSFYV